MVVGDVTTAVDVLVLGAGPGGYVAAIRAAQLGRHVTLVDQGRRVAHVSIAAAYRSKRCSLQASAMPRCALTIWQRWALLLSL